MYYIKYNEIDLTNVVKVREVEIPSLPSIKHSSIEVFERNGNIYNGASYNERSIRLVLLIQPTDVNNYDMYINDVKRAFYTKEECRLFCGNENLFMWCIPTNDILITELSTYCAEIEVNLIAYDPYWYSTEQNIVNNNNNNTFTVDNQSDVEIYPTFSIGFMSNSTFIQLENKMTKQHILLGAIPSSEKETVIKNNSVFKDACVSLSGWVSTSAPIDSGRSGGGTLALGTNGYNLICGNFGSTNSDTTWHGACYKKNLDTSLTDFRVKVNVSFNSYGVNGDPSNEFTYNDNESNIISGEIKPILVVNVANAEIFTTEFNAEVGDDATEEEKALLNKYKIGSISYGTTIENFSESSSGWYRYLYNDHTYAYIKKTSVKIGYIDNRYTSTYCNYVVTSATALRNSPNKLYTNIRTLNAGTVIRIETTNKYGDNQFYKVVQPYQGYVLVSDVIRASEYTIVYDREIDYADDKQGVIELYGYSENSTQLFKLSLCDDNKYYEFTYPTITKNGKDFLVDKTVAPNPKLKETRSDKGVTYTETRSGKYGGWNDFVGDLYIERINNVWYAYAYNKKGDKILKTKYVKDDTNSFEQLNYLVLYIGTNEGQDKTSAMSVNLIEITTENNALDTEKEYNEVIFKQGDVLKIDTSVPTVYLNDIERNDLVDIGSQFSPIIQGVNEIKVTSGSTPNVDVIWGNKYL